MSLRVLLLLIVGCSCDIKVSIDQKGNYKVSIIIYGFVHPVQLYMLIIDGIRPMTILYHY